MVFRFPYSTQTGGFKIIWSKNLVKQLWPPDECSRTEGRLSIYLAAKGFVLYTQQERILKWIDPSEWWRGKVDKQGESMVASYRYLEVSNPGLQMLGSNECDVSSQYGTLSSFQCFKRTHALYYSQALEALRQLESCMPSSENKWSVNGWMCCQN